MEPEVLLERARLLAERGRCLVEPNPLVGAIALDAHGVVAEGFHARYGGPHAEEVALERCLVQGRSPETLVVTLEPCSSVGAGKRRPPCTELICMAGVQRVVVGVLDPDPRHAGRGLELLREAGVEVLGPLPTPGLEALLTRFRQALERRRPWVLAKWAMTLDGKTATQSGSSRWISGEAALDWAHELRATADAVLVGFGTALTDDPELTVRRVTGKDPLRVVLDAEALLPPHAKLLRDRERGPVLVFVGAEADAGRVRALEAAGAKIDLCPFEAVSETGRRRVDLDYVLLRLREEYSVRRILVEGGGATLARFFERGAIDEVATCIAPKLVGGKRAPTPLGGQGIALMSDAVELEDVRTDLLGDCVRMHGFVRRAVLLVLFFVGACLASCGSASVPGELGLRAKFATEVPAELLQRFREAETLSHRGEAEAALALLDEIIAQQPLFVAAQRLRQILLRERGRAGLLWREVEELERRFPGRPEPHYLATRLMPRLYERYERIMEGQRRWPTSWWTTYAETWRRLRVREGEEEAQAAAMRLAQAAGDANWPGGALLAASLVDASKPWGGAQALFESLKQRFPDDASLDFARYRAGKAWWSLAESGIRGAPHAPSAAEVVRRVCSNPLQRRLFVDFLRETLRHEPGLIRGLIETVGAERLLTACRLESASDVEGAVLQVAIDERRHHGIGRVGFWYASPTRRVMREQAQRGDLEAVVATHETSLPRIVLEDEGNRLAPRVRALYRGPYRGIQQCPEGSAEARGALRALLDCGAVDEVLLLGLAWHKHEAEIADLVAEARSFQLFEVAFIERLSVLEEKSRLEDCLEVVRQVSLEILGQDVVGQVRILDFPVIGGRLVDPFGPGLPRFFDRYGKHLVLGTLDEPTRRPAIGIGTKVYERRLPVRPGLLVPGRGVEVMLESWSFATSLGLGFSEPAGIALWNHYVLDLRKWEEWVDDLQRLFDKFDADAGVLLDDPIPQADALSLNRPAQVDWKLLAAAQRSDGRYRERIGERVLTLLRLHEHAHIVDAQRFLPALRNPGASFQLFAKSGFQAAVLMADLEGRAELAALAFGADPRLTLAHLSSFIGDAYEEAGSPHRLGFARMLRRLVAAWEADGAPGAREPGSNLLAQLHLLDPERAVQYARTILAGLGF